MRVHRLVEILAVVAGCSGSPHTRSASPPTSPTAPDAPTDDQPTLRRPTPTTGGTVQPPDATGTRTTSVPAAPPTIAASPTGVAIVALPGVILDPATRTAFLMRETMQIEAVDIPTGKTRWSVKHTETPLWLSGTHLLAQSGATLVVLDARTGKRDKTCTPVGSASVVPLFAAGLGHQSRATVAGNGVDKATIEWSYDTHYAGGAHPTPEIERAARTHKGGTVDVDIAGCTLTERSTTSPPRVTPQAPPVTETKSGATTTYTQVIGIRAIDGIEASVALQTTDGTARALLRRQAAGNTLPEIELATGKAGYVHPQLSTDGRHVAVVAQDPTSGANGVFQYDTTLFDLATGTRIAAFRVPWHAGGVQLIGDTLVEMTSYGVRGFDLKANKERWKRSLRLTFYNGPMPP